MASEAGRSGGRSWTDVRWAVCGVAACALGLGTAGCGSSTDTGDAPDGGTSGATTGDLGLDSSVPGAGCSKVDILFVIDNSPSMKPWQEGLAKAFPTFVDEMVSRLPNKSLHVGMTTTSFWQGECGEAFKDCKTLATPAEITAHYMNPADGSTGANGEQGRLFDWQGKKFFDTNTADATGLKEWFSGAAVAAGDQGCSFEMPVAGAAYVGNPINDATNAGFVRDDKAIYLLFVLSDEVDKSPEGLDNYHQMVVDAKKVCGAGVGGEACVLTGGLVTPCVILGQDTEGLSQFLNGFGEPSVLGSIEEPDKYTDVVGKGLAQAVEHACADIPMPK